MRAAWYEQQGAARDVLVVGEMPDPEPGPDEVRIRIRASGLNPGDIKKRDDAFGLGMPYSRVIPHSDGAGVIESVGENVDPERIGNRVWCFGAQSYRQYGTAAEPCVVPSDQAVTLPDNVSFEHGACLGIPGITADRAVLVGGSVEGKTVLVQGGGGAVGQCAVALARRAGADVVASVRSNYDAEVAKSAGAGVVLRTDSRPKGWIVGELGEESIDHIVEVAFDSNIEDDSRLLRQGGTLSTYATRNPSVQISFWPLVFKNIALFFLGSDDFTQSSKLAAAERLNAVLIHGWKGFDIGGRFSLDEIAIAHEAVENRSVKGSVVLGLDD